MRAFERAMRNYILELRPVPDPKSKRERQLGALITPDALTCSGPGPLLDCACCRTRRWQQPSRHNCRMARWSCTAMGNGMPNLEREGFLKALFNQIPAFTVPRRSLPARACLFGSENRWSPELRARPIAYCALAAG